MNRRQLLKGLMAGGMIVAGELWIPGQKLISIPSGKEFYGKSIFELMGQTIRYIGPENQTVTITEFYNWLLSQADSMVHVNNDGLTHTVSLKHGYRIENAEHLVEGSLVQDSLQIHGQQSPQREHWMSVASLGDDTLVTDKVYTPDYYMSEWNHFDVKPRERISDSPDGDVKGWR